MMTSGQGYIETHVNPALMSHVIGNRSSGINSTKPSGATNPGERYATFSEVYGPFREDSMELKEETAYQRGMLEHIRDNMERINGLGALPETGYQHPDTSSPMDNSAESFHADMLDTSNPAQFYGGGTEDTTNGRYNEQDLREEFSSRSYRKPTYVELALSSPRKVAPIPSRGYAELSMATKTYSQMRARERGEKIVPSPRDVSYLQRNPLAPNFGISSLPPGWKANPHSNNEEFIWEQRSQGLAKFANRSARGNNRSLDLANPRISNMPGDSTMPWATARLPALSNSRSLPSLHTVDPYQGFYQGPQQGPYQGPQQGLYQGPQQGPQQGPHQGPYQGNTDTHGKVNIDINLNMVTPRGGTVYGRNQYAGEMGQGYSYNTVQKPVLNSLPTIPPVPLNSQQSTATVPAQYQPLSNNVQDNQKVRDITTVDSGTSIYPYRQMDNPWFPPRDEHPIVRKNWRKGKYGNYRVFDIHDYKKLQKELRLGSLIGEEKEPETLQEKKEKRAILHEYGRLVRAKNKEEMRPPLPL